MGEGSVTGVLTNDQHASLNLKLILEKSSAEEMQDAEDTGANQEKYVE